MIGKKIAFIFVFFASLILSSLVIDAALPPSIKVYFTDPLSSTPSKSSLSSEPKAIDDALVDFIDSMPQGATCYLAIYEMDNTKIIDAFNRASTQRGVAIYAVGYSTSATPSASSIWGLVGVSSYTRVHTSQYMHNKFVVLKDSAVWTGSYNFTNSATNQQDNNALLIYSKELAQLYQQEFDIFWSSHNFSQAKSTSTNSSNWNGKEIEVDGVKIKVYFNPYSDLVKSAILTEIEGEDRTTPPVLKPKSGVYICMAWITQNGILESLKNLSGDGVTVCGVFDDDSTNWDAYYYFKNSSATFVFDSRQTNFGVGLLHHKFAAIDPGMSSGRVITGSVNWSDAATTTNATSNDENLLIIYSPELSNIYYQEFLRLFRATGESIKTTATSTAKAVSSLVVYPSPARLYATIGYELSNIVSKLSIKIYSLSGSLVRDIAVSSIYPGFYNETQWDLKNSDGERVAPGVYFVKVEAETPDGKFFALKKIAVGK